MVRYGMLSFRKFTDFGEYEGLKEIRVQTNSNLIAPKNYESAGHGYDSPLLFCFFVNLAGECVQHAWMSLSPADKGIGRCVL